MTSVSMMSGASSQTKEQVGSYGSRQCDSPASAGTDSPTKPSESETPQALSSAVERRVAARVGEEWGVARIESFGQ